MSEQSNTGSENEGQAPFKLSPMALILNIVGICCIMFAAYEIYLINQTGTGFLSGTIGWPYYPWVIVIIGIVCMVPFHKQIIQAYKLVKKQQKEWDERNKPKF